MRQYAGSATVLAGCTLFILRHVITREWRVNPDAGADLLVSVGIGLLTAILAVLAGHVATENLRYRWSFYVCGFALASLFVVSGFRTYLAARRVVTPETIVMEAVNTANQHTDQTAAQTVTKANQHTDEQVSMVRGDLKDTNQQIGMVRDDLKGTINTVSDLFKKTEDNLTASIGKVGKPDPPIPPKISFTLWSATASVNSLVQASSLSPDSNGVFTVEFTVGNYSHATARSVDIWIDICTECSYSKEPEDFDRPAGMRDQTRHRMIPLMNRGTSVGKMAVQLKVLKPLEWFQIAMRYSCESCEGMSAPQAATITILPPLPKPISQ